MDILEAYKIVVPVLKELFEEDMAVCVTNREEILVYSKGYKIDLGNFPGKKLPDGDPLVTAMKEKKHSRAIVPKEHFGFPFIGISYIIFDEEGEVIGSVGIAKGIDKQVELEKTADEVFSSLQEVTASIEELFANSQEVSNLTQNVVTESKITEDKINETDKILLIIKEISNKSNLLALNASIEAARSGEAGRGFSVIANEMQKFAKMSKESADKISKLLNSMKESVNEIFLELNKTNTLTDNQTSAMEQMSNTLNDITNHSQKMLECSKMIVY